MLIHHADDVVGSDFLDAETVADAVRRAARASNFSETTN